jgi:hypothetical protein
VVGGVASTAAEADRVVPGAARRRREAADECALALVELGQEDVEAGLLGDGNLFSSSKWASRLVSQLDGQDDRSASHSPLALPP